MLRNILKFKVRDHIRITDILDQTKAKGVGGVIKKFKFDHAGHLARESNFKWNKITTMWIPQKKGERGRLVTCLSDEICRSVSSGWITRSKNWPEWAKLCKAYAQKRVD